MLVNLKLTMLGMLIQLLVGRYIYVVDLEGNWSMCIQSLDHIHFFF